MGYSSASEGEIMEGEGDKATTTRTSTTDTAINRKSRPRSNMDDGAADYALDYGDGPHGHKRRREEDTSYSRNQSDSRRFRDDADDRRRKTTYRDDRDSYRSARHGRYDDREPAKRHQSDRHGRYQSDRRRSRSPNRFQTHTQSGSGSYEDTSRSRRSSTSSSFNPGGKRAEPTSTSRQENASTVAPQEKEEVEAVVVDEAKLIEERRKRREALRAKHRGQNAPLLHQALEMSAVSQPDTPSAVSDMQVDTSGESHVAFPTSSADVGSDAPSTVASPSASQPASPAAFSVANDEELANPAHLSSNSQLEADGPSAADYDPTMDMQETKQREQRAGKDAGAADYDEMQDDDRAVILPKATSEPPQEAREFDMFADDDDEDMFAPEPDAGHKKDDGTQAVRIPEAKQLDRNLLDDWDDPEGYYRIILGELLDGRYHVQSNLGKGVFSAVVRALDTQTDQLVAIKVIRKQESM